MIPVIAVILASSLIGGGWRPTFNGVSSGRRTRDQEQLAPVVRSPSHHTVVLYTRGLVFVVGVTLCFAGHPARELESLGAPSSHRGRGRK